MPTLADHFRALPSALARAAGVFTSTLRSGTARPGYWQGTGVLAGPYFTDSDRTRRAPAPTELVEAFRSIAYACARINFQAMGRVPLRLYRTTLSGTHRPKGLRDPSYLPLAPVSPGEQRRLKSLGGLARYTKGVDAIQEVVEHPLLEAVTGVNPDWDHITLIQYTSACLDILGRAHWWMEPSGPLPVAQVWPLLPQYVLPIRGQEYATVDHFQYGQMTLPVKEVLSVNMIAMRDPYVLGVGSAEAAFPHLSVFDLLVSYQRNTFEQGAKPSMIVSSKDSAEPMGPAERERFQRDINAQLVRGGQGFAWVVDGAIDVKPVSFNLADVGAMGISGEALQRTANCFGVPLSLLKTEDVNLANAEAGHRQHAELTVDPRCAMLASALTKWTRAAGRRTEKAFRAAGRNVELNWDQLLWAFDNPVKEDQERTAKVHDMYLKAGALTINEVRNDLGRESVPWGDEPWLTGTLQQPSTGAEQRQLANERADRLASQPPPALPGQDQDGDESDESDESDEADEADDDRPGDKPKPEPKAEADKDSPDRPAKPRKPKPGKKALDGAEPLRPVPSAAAILRVALRRRGWADRYAAGALTLDERLNLLEDLRRLGRAYLRREAERARAELDRQAAGLKGMQPGAGALEARRDKILTGGAAEAARNFFGRTKRFIRNLMMAGALALGGPAPLSDAEARAIDRAHAVQVDYLRDFERDVLAGDGMALDPARASSYGASVWGAAHQARHVKAAEHPGTFGRRIHRALDAPCVTCAVEQARGWLPAEQVLPIGSAECRGNCHCHILYSDNLDDEPEDPFPAGDFRNLMVRWVPAPAARRVSKTVVVDVAKLDSGWRRDGTYYLPPGAEAAEERREAILALLDQARRDGTGVEQPRVLVGPDDVVRFVAGQDQFAALRDLGIRFLPVSVLRDGLAAARERYAYQAQDAETP